MEELIWVDEPGKKASIAESILIHLPDWFGLRESTQHYIEESRSLPFLAFLSEVKPVGFAVLRKTSPQTVELYVMGVLPEYHRQGIGTRLFLALKDYAKAHDFEYMQVKTVQTGHYEEYDRTNRFYQRMGFRELEVLPLWDEWNPCQVYVMALIKGAESFLQ